MQVLVMSCNGGSAFLPGLPELVKLHCIWCNVLRVSDGLLKTYMYIDSY